MSRCVKSEYILSVCNSLNLDYTNIISKIDIEEPSWERALLEHIKEITKNGKQV